MKKLLLAIALLMPIASFAMHCHSFHDFSTLRYSSIVPGGVRCTYHNGTSTFIPGSFYPKHLSHWSRSIDGNLNCYGHCSFRPYY